MVEILGGEIFLRADGSWKIGGREIPETWKNKHAKRTSTIVES